MKKDKKEASELRQIIKERIKLNGYDDFKLAAKDGDLDFIRVLLSYLDDDEKKEALSHLFDDMLDFYEKYSKDKA